MTSAALVFCCVIALALAQGFGAPAFSATVASDAINAILPLLGFLVVARFAEKRMPAHARLIRRLHVALQALVVAMSQGWWWVEPHAMLTSLTGGSLAGMGWQALVGAVFGLLLALAAERSVSPVVMREVGLASWVLFLIGGGRVYRGYDHVEAGARVWAAGSIVVVVVATAVLAYLLLRRREKLAAAFPALAPALACLALLAAARGGGPAEPSSRDSIVLVVVDTLRADIADGRMESDRDAMPELARIASAGVRFTQAVSPAPWTLPATVSLLSGWNPHRHGFGASASTWEVSRGDGAALYLATALRDAGYLTAAFVNNPYLRPWFGFDKGLYTLRPYHGHALDGVALALDWLHDHTGSASLSLLHLMDPHWPYDAPPGFGAPRQPCAFCDSLLFTQFGATSTEVRDEVKRRYAAEVHYTDALIGRYYDTLAGAGVLEHTWFIVTADHGEELWDHGGFMHGHTLNDELLRVPLVVVPPRAATDAKRGLRIDQQVRLEDVAATMLDIAGLDVHRAIDGRTLLGVMAGRPDGLPHVEISGFVKNPNDLRYSVRSLPWKAIVSTEPLGSRMYRLDTDPGEQRNLALNPAIPAQESAEAGMHFAQLLAAPNFLGLDVARRRAEPAGSVPDADTQRSLKSLGYAH